MQKIAWIFALGMLLLTACNLPGLTPPPPTNTPGPTPTPTSTVTPLPSPTPSPTPSPPPEARIEGAEKALFNGDYARAQEEFQTALASSAEDAVRRTALWGLGRTQYLNEDYPAALETLRSLVQTYPDYDQTPRAWFLLGETFFDLKRYQEATEAYLNYLNARPGLLDAYVHEKRGEAFLAYKDYSNALNSYQAALQTPEQSAPLSVRTKIANTYLYAGDAETALKLYKEIASTSTDEYIQAQMDFLAGSALITLGRAEEGYARWRHAVDFYPKSYDSYSALVGLVDAGQPVDEFNRGLVDYFVGQHGAAVAAFDRYMEANADHDGTSLHYKALSQREMGEHEAAIETWNTFIDKYPGNRYWAAAWDERAFTQWAYLEQYVPAAEGLEKFAREVSGSPFAVTYLMQAARIYERGEELEKAASLWESLPNRFPADSQLGEAQFQAGIVRYRQKNYPKANEDFQNALPLAATVNDRARILLWVGKTYASAGDMNNANTAWQQAQALDTSEYYSVRARDLLNNRAPFAAPPVMNLNYDLNAERLEAASWLRIKFSLPAETDLSSLGALAGDPRLLRGTELWKMGLYDQAKVEFETLRAAIEADAAESFRLGNYLLDLGAYRSAIFALRQVLTLAGMDEHSDSLNAPVYFKHVRYGLYYSDLIWPAAEENSFDPLFITSLVRQESLFEGFVHSTAGARGLMQIIPPTGESIAQQMGWPPNYTANDLYSPHVSVRLGTYYLNANRRLLNGDIYAALAAYNGGPGNAAIWQQLAGNDPDLFLEVVRFGESRDYIRLIYETYTIYRALYSPMQ